MKRWAVFAVLAALALAAGLALMSRAPHQWSVLLVIAEPPGGAWLPGPGGAAKTPRIRKLSGAGVRLPLQAPRQDLPQFLVSLLGPGTPGVGVLAAWEDRGWARVIASSQPLPEGFAARFDGSSVGGSEDVVDRMLSGLQAADVRPGDPALAVLVAQPRTGEEWDRVVSRSVDGAGSRLTLARTLVVIVDRGERSALLIAPERPDTLAIDGALGPEQLGAELARWLRLQGQ